ncbi:hypothetical protein E4U45_006853 [Claviceps purpurea]|nr:hypothetical protein E4U45_006853 [Claviceps purpurea]
MATVRPSTLRFLRRGNHYCTLIICPNARRSGFKFAVCRRLGAASWYTVHRNSPSYFENCVLHLLEERPRHTEDNQTDFKFEKRSARKHCISVFWMSRLLEMPS